MHDQGVGADWKRRAKDLQIALPAQRNQEHPRSGGIAQLAVFGTVHQRPDDRSTERRGGRLNRSLQPAAQGNIEYRHCFNTHCLRLAKVKPEYTEFTFLKTIRNFRSPRLSTFEYQPD